MSTARFFLHLLKTSIKASMSTRAAFLLEISLMIANNLIFFFIWWIFFRQFDDISGWRFSDMAILMAVGMGGYGLMQVCFGGVRELSNTIVNGDLDPFLTQPKNVMLHVAGSRSLTRGWGHLGTTAILVLFTGMTALSTLLLILMSIICGCIVYTSFSLMVHSLAFWAGPIDSLSRKYCDALFLFSLYPTNIYSGFLQVMMFTLIPAGIIGYLPVELLRSFSWMKLGALVGSALAFLGLAIAVFHKGLKRYV
ncbi:MAG: ABC transporter permease [Parachlamydia sp.]|nr:ABC transporter permease [Parachlamydia sp.]